MNQKDFNRLRRTLNKRIDALAAAGYYIEAIFLMAAVIERELRTILEQYEVLIQDHLRYEKGRKLKFSIKIFTNKDIQKMTIGQLIGYVSIIHINKSLLRDLNRFNKLRCNIVHGLFMAKSVKNLDTMSKKLLAKKIILAIDVEIV